MEVTFNGVTLRHQDWAKICGVSEQTMRWRLHEWGVERAVTTHGSRQKGKRKGYRKRGLTNAQKEQIVTRYAEGASEDVIAMEVSKSRKAVSRYLMRSGVKRKGNAPARLIEGAEVKCTRDKIIITVSKAGG